MAVAKSYVNLKQLCTPYEMNGRMYIKVQTKSGEKQVRWYTDVEYAKMYGQTIVATSKTIGVDGMDHSHDKYFKTQKELLGFKNGYITIFKGDTYPYKEWFKEHGCVFNKHWGWALSSEKNDIDDDLPYGIQSLRLDWLLVGDNETERLKADEQILEAVESLLYDGGNSQFVGEIGDRILIELTVEKNIPVEGYFGISCMHIMTDADENKYIWTTSAQNWAEGTTRLVAGTIKDHRTYKNVKQTVLVRCKEKTVE